MPITKNYSTSDIHIAATLLALGHPISQTTRSQEQFGRRPKAIFHFDDSAEVRTAILSYTNDSLQLNPRELFSRLRELKSLVHNIFA